MLVTFFPIVTFLRFLSFLNALFPIETTLYLTPSYVTEAPTLIFLTVFFLTPTTETSPIFLPSLVPVLRTLYLRFFTANLVPTT